MPELRSFLLLSPGLVPAGLGLPRNALSRTFGLQLKPFGTPQLGDLSSAHQRGRLKFLSLDLVPNPRLLRAWDGSAVPTRDCGECKYPKCSKISESALDTWGKKRWNRNSSQRSSKHSAPGDSPAP